MSGDTPKTMTDQDFLNKGYNEYPPSQFEDENVVKLFQKCFKDNIGKKYYITVDKWKEWTHPYTKKKYPPAYEYKVQLYANGTHNAIDILYHHTWTLDDVEKHVEDLFTNGNYDYSVRWGDYE